MSQQQSHHAMSSSPLIGVDELASYLAGDRPDLVLVDARWVLPGSPAGPTGLEQFDLAHIPGSAFVDVDVDLADPPGGLRGRHPLPNVQRFQAAMRRVGVSEGSDVVVLDGGAGIAAARCWWLLRHHGHGLVRGRVRVLDGGMAAWLARSGVTITAESDTHVVVPGDFTAAPGLLATVEADDLTNLEAGPTSVVLLDSRAPARFNGEVEPVDPVAGHVPGAVNLPVAATVDDLGRLLPPERLTAAIAQVLPQTLLADTTIVASCGSGVTAAHTLLALEVAGLGSQTALFPDSFSGWIADPSRPVATGPAAGS